MKNIKSKLKVKKWIAAVQKHLLSWHISKTNLLCITLSITVYLNGGGGNITAYNLIDSYIDHDWQLHVSWTFLEYYSNEKVARLVNMWWLKWGVYDEVT